MEVFKGIASKKLGVGAAALAAIMATEAVELPKMICITVLGVAYLLAQGFADGVSRKYAKE